MIIHVPKMVVPIRARVVSRMYDADGNLIDLFHTSNFLTEVGEAHIAKILAGTDSISHMAIGTGTGRDRTATTLVTERTRQALDGGTPTQGAGADDNDITFSRTFATSDPATDYTFTEAALFNDPTTGTMINYIEFSPGRFKATTMTWALDIIWTVGAS